MSQSTRSPFSEPLYADFSAQESEDLPELARKIRVDILRLAYATRTHHIGPAFSSVEILVSLYFGFMNAAAKNDAHRFILSKGHAALALYVVLAHRGTLPLKELRRYCNHGAQLGQHPSINPEWGIEVTSGSLGHGLSIGVGSALGSLQRKSQARTIVLLGDGELNEGSVWEAAAFAGHHKLGNLLAIIDRNDSQCLGSANSILDMNPLAEKFNTFNWNSISVDGHDIPALHEALRDNREVPCRPLAIIASTVKGRGVSFMENNCVWHHNTLNKEEYHRALKLLGEHES